MNFPLFLAKRITTKGNRTFSRLIVRVAITGIILGLTVMILSLAVLRGFKQEVISKQRGNAGDITVFKFDLNTSNDNTPFVLSDSSKATLMQMKGIERIQPIATKPAIINANDEVEGVVLKGISKEYDQSYISRILIGGEGIDFSDEEKAKEQVIISKVTANR